MSRANGKFVRRTPPIESGVGNLPGPVVNRDPVGDAPVSAPDPRAATGKNLTAKFAAMLQTRFTPEGA